MKDMLEAEIWTIAKTDQGNVVLLRPFRSDILVPIFIGPLEAQYILIGFGDEAVKRPLTPDLFLMLVHQVGLDLRRAEVHDLKANTFHARLILTGGEYTSREPLALDARPSDAFSLAVRRKCPILVAKTIVEQTGIPVDLVMENVEDGVLFAGIFELPPAKTPDLHSSRAPRSGKGRDLQKELEEAVAAEEYERAAELRDMLILLNKGY
jgi:bifunctional DNase/RNase